MDRYIGLDVHATSTTAAIVDGRGRLLDTRVLETNGRVLVEFLKGQSGTVHLCLEEGTQAGWLYGVMSPHVAETVVTRVKRSRGQKSDKVDAFGLAEMLRRGAIDIRVFKEEGEYGVLRQLVKVHLWTVQDAVRTQMRLKALYRSRGIRVVGQRVYSVQGREECLAKLPSRIRSSAELLYAQYDGMRELRDEAERELVAESHRHPISRVLETCPGLGSVRVARLLAVVVTPHRFRRRSQLWAYCGLGIVMRSSSDWVQAPDGSWVRAKVKQTRGLNRNHNRVLKAVFKGAATTVTNQHRDSAFAQDYRRQLEGGTKPNLAKLTLARRIAATALAMWKNEEVYDPDRSARTKK
jgi:transposase